MSDPRVDTGSYFPVTVVDATGRRVRPGNAVGFDDEGATRTAVVTGWHIEGLVMVTVEDDPVDPHAVVMRHPSEVRRIDIDVDEDTLLPDFFVEVDGPSTLVVKCIGDRDLEYVGGPDGTLAQLVGPDWVDGTGSPRREAIRPWSKRVIEHLDGLDGAARKEVVRSELRAPILERVLQEAVLPRRIRRLVLLATDQGEGSSRDTLHSAAILRHWLEAWGHVVGVGAPEYGRRWIEEVRVETVVALPHVIEAVTHRVRSMMPRWSEGCERVVVVQGGGTPAMNMAVLLACALQRDAVVRHVQVPEPDPISGRRQSLIEMDLADMPEVGGALSQERR